MIIESQAPTRIDLAGGTTSIEAEVEYDPRHPYAVTTTFMTGPDQVRWTFGRNLLSAGLHEPVGDGDVHVRPHLDAAGRAVVVIELSSPSGIARVQGRWGDLSEFVERMLRCRMVPYPERFSAGIASELFQKSSPFTSP